MGKAKISGKSSTASAKKAIGAKSVINTSVDVKVEQSKDEKRKYYCTCCDKSWYTQNGHFSKSNSSIYKSNNGYINVCRDCVDKYYYALVELYSGVEEKAIERVCQTFDWFFHEEPLGASKKISENRSRIGSYISKMNLWQTKKKGTTYVDTIKLRFLEENTAINSIEDIKDVKDIKLTQKIVRFWGTGFEPEQYKFLQNQYDEWITRNECKTKAQEELFKALCFAQLNILTTQQNNGKVNDAMKSFQDLLGSANLKPTQNNDNALADQNTFGTLINKWENEKPIPEPDPEWKDVDGIGRYITVFFLGHLCKMMGIKNSYSKEYEKEMEKYRVEKPEYFEDEEVDFDKIFGGDTDG